MRFRSEITVGLPLVALIIQSVGCAREALFPTGPVSGHVRLDGRPLPNGVIRFVPIQGTPGPKTSVQVIEGKFEASKKAGPPIGTHRIEIESADMGGYKMDDEEALELLQSQKNKRLRVLRIPARYNARSILVEQVSGSDTNKFNFELSSRKQL